MAPKSEKEKKERDEEIRLRKKRLFLRRVEQHNRKMKG